MKVFTAFTLFGIGGLSIFTVVFSTFVAESLRGIREAQRIQSEKLDLVVRRYYSKPSLKNPREE